MIALPHLKLQTNKRQENSNADGSGVQNVPEQAGHTRE